MWASPPTRMGNVCYSSGTVLDFQVSPPHPALRGHPLQAGEGRGFGGRGAAAGRFCVPPHTRQGLRPCHPLPGEGQAPHPSGLRPATFSQERVTIHKFPGKFRLFLCPSGVEKGLTLRGGYDIVIIQKNILPPPGRKYGKEKRTGKCVLSGWYGPILSLRWWPWRRR